MNSVGLNQCWKVGTAREFLILKKKQHFYKEKFSSYCYFNTKFIAFSQWPLGLAKWTHVLFRPWIHDILNIYGKKLLPFRCP